MTFDPAHVEFVRDITPVWLVILFTLLSFLGSTYYQVPMLVLFYTAKARDRIATWLGIVIGSYAFRSLLKNLNDKERPPVDPPLDPAVFPALVRPVYEHPAEISTTSFPSGHAIAATVLWGLLVVDTDFGTRRKRLLLAATVVFVVAASRVVLGAHYIEDVVAGVVFGVLFLGTALLVRKRSSRPVAATFGLAAVLSLVVVSFTVSRTGSMVLGVSVGVLAVVLGPRVLAGSRTLNLYQLWGVTALGALLVGAGLVFLNVIYPVLAVGVVLGAAWFWLPRLRFVRSLLPDIGTDSTTTGTSETKPR